MGRNDPTVEEILRMIARQDERALRDEQRLLSLFADYSKGKMAAQQRQLAIFCQCDGHITIQKLRGASGTDQQRGYHRLIREMVDGYGLRREVALDISGAYWRIALGTEPPETSSPSSCAPSTSPPSRRSRPCACSLSCSRKRGADVEHPNTAWTDPMPRGARIAGWVYFPIHAVVLPLTLGMLLLAVLSEQPSDVTCNVLYYLCGLVFTLIAMWRFLRRSFDTMVGSILRCLGMMFAAYGIDVLLSLVLQLGTSLIGELPVPNNDAVTGLARTDYKRMIAVAARMAPLVEECLFRGVVFGTIRPKSRSWAYAASIALFSLYHVWQYVLVYQDPKLLLSALAYVPVSAALTFCYEQTRSIWPPVFFHMCINALSLTVLTG